MSTGSKMTIFLVLLILVYLAFGWLIHWQLSYISDLVELIYRHPLATTREALSGERDILAIDRDIKNILLVKDPQKRKSLFLDISIEQSNMMLELDLLLKSVLLERGRKVTLKTKDLLTQRNEVIKRFADAIDRGDDKFAMELDSTEGYKITKQIEEAMSMLVGFATNRSMKVQKESHNSLERSKLILFSSGIAIFILSILFALLISRWLLLSLRQTRIALLKSSKKPFDLSLQLKPQSTENINVAINNLITNLSAEMTKLSKNIGQLEKELITTTDALTAVPQALDETLPKMELTVKNIESLTTGHNRDSDRIGIFSDLFNGVRGELIVLSKIAANLDFTIAQLRLSDPSSLETKPLLADLEDHDRALNNRAQKIVQYIENLSDHIHSFDNQLMGLSDLAQEQTAIIGDLSHIKELFHIEKKKLSDMKTALNKLTTQISELKLY